MKQAIYILLAAFLTAGVSVLVGNALLREMRAKFARTETMFVAFVLGSGVLAGVVFALTAIGQGRKGVFLIAAGLLCGLAVWRDGHRFPERDSQAAPVWFWLVYAAFALLYVPAAMAPEMSADGTAHYLTHVQAYATGFSGVIPDGAEALFLFAYSIGKGSAASMVALLFLLALPRAMRVESPAAAILVFASPIVAATGTIAAPDVMLAAIAYALFLAIERRAWLVAAILAVFFAWTFAPWVERELARPALHMNAWFARLPFDLTVHGERTFGLLGPVFLLLPLALLRNSRKTQRGAIVSLPVSARAARFALLTKHRRWLAAGLLLALPALGAMEARVFIPALPFFALALVSVLREIPMALPAIVTAHVVFSWPWFMNLYVREPELRLSADSPIDTWLVETWSAALRIEPEDVYLNRKMDSYALGRLLEITVPDSERILAFKPFQTIYHTRTMVDDARLRDLVDQPTLDGVRKLREAGVQWLIVPPKHPAAEILLTRSAEWGLQLRLFDREYAVFYIPELN